MTIRINSIKLFNNFPTNPQNVRISTIKKPLPCYIPISDYIGPIYEDKFISHKKA